MLLDYDKHEERPRPLNVYDVAVTVHVVVKGRTAADAMNKVQEMMTCPPDEIKTRRIS